MDSKEQGYKRPRTSKPKVKTGCKTCKKRHIKCDETKPECLRCSNFGRKCDGYYTPEDELAKKDPTPPPTRKLLSKADRDSLKPCGSTRIQSLTPPPINVLFHDEQEYRYFCVFRESVAVELADGFESTIWNTIIPGACDYSMAIRQLTTAIAALSLADGLARTGELVRSDDGFRHRQYALMQYGRALKGIQVMYSKGEDCIRIALMTALLIFVFESMHGDTMRAFTPIKSALELILKRLRANPATIHNPNSNGPNAIQRLEDELILAFVRQDHASLLLFPTPSYGTPEPETPMHSFYTTIHLNFPLAFSSLSEARIYLDDIKWRWFPQSRVIQRVVGATPLEWENTLPTPFLSTVQTPCTGDINTPNNVLRVQCMQWQEAFEPLYLSCTSSPSSSAFIAATILKVRALCHDLILRTSSTSVPDSTMESTETFTLSCAIVNLAKRLANHPAFFKGFVFDYGVLPPLATVIARSSDQALRWEACRVVESMVPRREAIWDSRVMLEEGLRLLGAKSPGETVAIDPRLLADGASPAHRRTPSPYLEPDGSVGGSDGELMIRFLGLQV